MGLEKAARNAAPQDVEFPDGLDGLTVDSPDLGWPNRCVARGWGSAVGLPDFRGLEG